MNTHSSVSTEKQFGCETCALRARAEAKPNSFIARLWRWHTRWCPGWKAYQAHLTEKNNPQSGGKHV